MTAGFAALLRRNQRAAERARLRFEFPPGAAREVVVLEEEGLRPPTRLADASYGTADIDRIVRQSEVLPLGELWFSGAFERLPA